MQTFKRISLSILAFVAAFLVFSAVVVVPYLNSEYDAFQDVHVRNDLAGSIDCIVIGSSQLMDGVDPRTLDEQTGGFSYNLSSNSSPMYARAMLLEEELQRNPVKTVVLGVSYNSLSKTPGEDYQEGDLFAFAKLASVGDMGEYVTQNLSPSGCVNLYARLANRGIAYLGHAAIGHSGSNVNWDARGYTYQDCVDLTQLSDDERWSILPGTVVSSFDATQVEGFHEIAQLCREYGAQLIVIQAPLSEWALGHVQGFDEFEVAVDELCASEDVPFLDFNLYKTRTEFLDDATSFSAENHLCDAGAQAFSAELGSCLAALEAGEDVSDRFYSTYTEAVAHF